MSEWLRLTDEQLEALAMLNTTDLRYSAVSWRAVVHELQERRAADRAPQDMEAVGRAAHKAFQEWLAPRGLQADSPDPMARVTSLACEEAFCAGYKAGAAAALAPAPQEERG